MKRILTVLLLIGIVLAAGYTLFEMSGSEEALIDPWQHVPASTAIVFEFPEPEKAWNELAGQSQVWQALRSQPVVDQLHQLLSCSFSAPQRESAIAPFCELPMLLALDRVNAQRSSALIILSSKTAVDRGGLLRLLSCLDPNIVKDAQKLDEDNYTLKLDSSIGSMHVRINDKTLLIASDKDLLHIDAGDSTFSQLASVQRIRGTLGKGADVHVVMDTDLAERYLDIFLRPDKQRLLDMPAGMAGLDLQIRSRDLLVSGVIAAKDRQDIEDLGQYGGPNRPARMVGKQTSYMYSVHINEPLSFSDRMIEKDPKLRKALDQMQDSLLIDVQHLLTSWISGEVVISLQDDNPSVKWTTARAIDGISAARSFDALAEAYLARGQEVERTQVNQRITYHFPEPLPLGVLGPAFKKMYPSHVGIYEDLVLFTSTASTMQKTLSALENGNTLDQELRTVVQFDDISEEHSTLMWCDLARSKELASHYIDVNKAQGDTGTLDQLGALSMMIGAEQNGFHHVSIQLQHAPLQQRTDPSVFWKSDLASRVERKPDILEDHTTSGRNVLVQDVEGALHFFSGTGEKLWQRDIGEAIIGGVHQVDRYKNKKLQMLFNTASQIHLIDRNGHDVEGYPIAINKGTAAPMGLMDYDADQNYRIIISDNSGELYNYALNGKAVQWDPITLQSGTQQAVQHVRVRSKDYLLAIERDGQMHLLDRKGQPRHSPTLTLPGIDGNQVHVNSSISIGDCQVWWTDSLGQVWKGRFDGDPQMISGQQWSDYFFHLADLDEDGELDPILAWADSVKVRSSENGIFTFNVPGTINSAPIVFDFGKGKKRIGISIDDDEGLYLYDITGTLIDDMPKEGNSAFSINDLNADGKLEIIGVKQGEQVLVHSCP